MLGEDVSGRLSLNQVEIVKLRERFYGVIHLSGRLALGRQANALVFEHVFVPGACPGAGGNDNVTQPIMTTTWQARATSARGRHVLGQTLALLRCEQA